jgi:hypothetical protein
MRLCLSLLITPASAAAIVALSTAAFAQQTGGTAVEAKAMLMKAVAAVRADKVKALDMFNKGEGGFRDRDLYVFCANASDGTLVAIGNPNLKQALGMDIRAGQNSTGEAFGDKSTRRCKSRKVKSPRSAI